MKEKQKFLTRYVGDWPIKEFLKRRFSNQRSYQRRRGYSYLESEGNAVGNERLSDFGSDIDAGNEGREESDGRDANEGSTGNANEDD